MDGMGEIEVKASLEFGGADMRLRELPLLTPEATVMLDREVGSAVDVVVGECVVVRGEVVIIEGQFAPRVLECVGRQMPETEAIQ